ncbi:MAG: class I SAM-dependent methyltransferase [Candidatus Margulisiibacteriota bacterium]
MELLTKVRRLGYTQLAESARLHRMTSAGFSNAQGLRPMGETQRAAYFLLALYYIAHDQFLSSTSLTSSFLPQTFLQVCLDGVDEGGFGPKTLKPSIGMQQLCMLGAMDGSAEPLTAEGAAHILIDSIMRSPDYCYSFSDLQTTFKKEYSAYGQVDAKTLKSALAILLREKEIIAMPDGQGFKRYNQVLEIKTVAHYLAEKLPTVTDLGRLFSLAGKAMKTLFDNVDLYLISEVPDADPEMKIVFGDEHSNHRAWSVEKKGGVFQTLLEKSERGKPESLSIENISSSDLVSANGPIFPDDIKAYGARFSWPDAVLFAAASVTRITSDSKQTVGAIGLKVHGWAKKDAGPNSVVYRERSSESEKMEVDQAIEGLVLTIANQVARLAALKPKKSLKDLLPEEHGLSRGPEGISVAGLPVPAALQHDVPKPGEVGFGTWTRRNELAMSNFYDRFSLTFAHICRLSRAYQVSVIEGVERVLNLIQEKWPGQKIEIIDAGVGSAYFLERLMKTAEQRNLNVWTTALDISFTAVNIAKSVCEAMGDKVVVSRGNMTKMTKSLDDIDPIPLSSKKLVCLNYVLQYVSAEAVLKQVYSVLEEGGLLLITNFKPKNTMRWNEFWINWRASWHYGGEMKFGHGRWYEMFRYIFLFLRHPFGIVRFARGIDRDVRAHVIPENPTPDQIKVLLEEQGFEVVGGIDDSSHFGAAIQLVAQKKASKSETASKTEEAPA